MPARPRLSTKLQKAGNRIRAQLWITPMRNEDSSAFVKQVIDSHTETRWLSLHCYHASTRSLRCPWYQLVRTRSPAVAASIPRHHAYTQANLIACSPPQQSLCTPATL